METDAHVQPVLRIGVLTRNSAHTIGETLESLAAQSLPSRFWSVTFIDNNSSDQTVEVLRRFMAKHENLNCDLIVRRENNIAESRQAVADGFLSKWIGFIDSDVTVPSNWAEKAIEICQKNETNEAFAGVGGPLHLRSASASLKVLHRIQQSFFGHFMTEQMYLNPRSRRVTHLPAAAAVFRRSLLVQHGFCRSMQNCGEDLEIGERLSGRGYTLISSPELASIHRLNCAGRRAWIRRAFQFGRARIRVARRNPHVWRRARTWLPLVLASIQSALLIFGLFNPQSWTLLIGILMGHLAAIVFEFVVSTGQVSFEAAGLTWLTHEYFAFGELFECLAGTGRSQSQAGH